MLSEIQSSITNVLSGQDGTGDMTGGSLSPKSCLNKYNIEIKIDLYTNIRILCTMAKSGNQLMGLSIKYNKPLPYSNDEKLICM